MSFLLDTNILTRSSQPRHPMHPVAVEAVVSLLQQGEDLFLVPQNFYEFWSVATRPVAINGLGLSVSQVAGEILRFKIDFPVLDDVPALFQVWEQLVIRHQVIGKSTHDARLVAAMIVHGVDRLLTFHRADFARYTSIIVLSPQDVIAPPPTP